MKYLVRLCVICIIANLLAIPASAHAGRTDDNGGHTDRETGEYHYHHGYPAHQHEDRDGDGYAEYCPYDFDDQTGIHSGNSSGTSGGSSGSQSSSELKKQYQNGYQDGKDAGYDSGYNSGYREAEAEAGEQINAANQEISDLKNQMESEKRKANKEGQQNAYMVSILFCAPVLAFAVWSWATSRKEKEIQSLKSELIQTENRVAMLQTSSKVTVPEGIPMGVKLNFKCLPTKGNVSGLYPYGEFTVFVSPSGKKFHRRYNCCNAINPLHLFEVGGKYEPCSKCASGSLWACAPPEWYREIVRSLAEGTELEAPQKQEVRPLEKPKYVEPEVHKFDSSFVKSISYRDEQLLVELPNGSYCYYDVPESVYSAFLGAPSKGKFFRENVMDKYPFY